MAQISTARKLSIAGRVAARHAGQNRWVRAMVSAGTATFKSVSHVLHLLLLEVTGLFFLVFAIIGGVALQREYHAWVAGKVGLAKPAAALAFMVVFGWFAVTSFWRTRRK